MTIDFSKIWLGMENDWYMKNSDTSYPRYNIVENTVAGSFRLEIACARLATRRTRVNSG